MEYYEHIVKKPRHGSHWATLDNGSDLFLSFLVGLGGRAGGILTMDLLCLGMRDVVLLAPCAKGAPWWKRVTAAKPFSQRGRAVT